MKKYINVDQWACVYGFVPETYFAATYRTKQEAVEAVIGYPRTLIHIKRRFLVRDAIQEREDMIAKGHWR